MTDTNDIGASDNSAPLTEEQLQYLLACSQFLANPHNIVNEHSEQIRKANPNFWGRIWLRFHFLKAAGCHDDDLEEDAAVRYAVKANACLRDIGRIRAFCEGEKNWVLFDYSSTAHWGNVDRFAYETVLPTGGTEFRIAHRGVRGLWDTGKNMLGYDTFTSEDYICIALNIKAKAGQNEGYTCTLLGNAENRAAIYHAVKKMGLEKHINAKQREKLEKNYASDGDFEAKDQKQSEKMEDIAQKVEYLMTHPDKVTPDPNGARDLEIGQGAPASNGDSPPQQKADPDGGNKGAADTALVPVDQPPEEPAPENPPPENQTPKYPASAGPLTRIHASGGLPVKQCPCNLFEEACNPAHDEAGNGANRDGNIIDAKFEPVKDEDKASNSPVVLRRIDVAPNLIIGPESPPLLPSS